MVQSFESRSISNDLDRLLSLDIDIFCKNAEDPLINRERQRRNELICLTSILNDDGMAF